MQTPSPYLFSEAHYLRNNPDVAAAVAAGAFASGLQHWQLFGQHEGRVASALFDLQSYRTLNPDLAEAGLLTDSQIIVHFNRYGVYENRPFINPVIFDATYYAALNPDLYGSGIRSTIELQQHFQKYGFFEGRIAHPSLDGVSYIASNPDLNAFFNATGKLLGQTDRDTAGILHYYQYGVNEGRTLSATRPISSVTSSDPDNTETYTQGDTLTIRFNTPVQLSSFTLSDILVTGGHSLGRGARLEAINPTNQSATEFKIVLGASPTIGGSDLLSIAKGSIAYSDTQVSTKTEVFVLPKADTSSPQVATLQSIVANDKNTDGTYGLGDTVTIRFSEPIKTSLKIGDITLSNNHRFGSSATLTPVNPQDGYATEFVIQLGRNATFAASDTISISKGAVIDQSGNVALTNLSFVAPELSPPGGGGGSAPSDSTAPTLSGSNPTDNAMAVAVSANIVLTFSENIVAGTGNIIISDGSDTRTIAIADPQINIVGNVLTINPTFDLLPSSMYNVQMASGVVVDASGNPFSGITNNTTLNFDTAAPDITSPVASAFVMTATTVGATSNESGTLGIYAGGSLIGSTATFTAPGALTQTLTPSAQLSVTSALLKVFDTSNNQAVDTHNLILGTAGGDAILGSAASDFIFGFSGVDAIEGALGADTLSGGLGGDAFYFNTTIGSTSDSTLSSGFDSITDLEATDQIVVQMYELMQFDASSSNYVVTNRATDQNLLIFNIDGDGDDGNGSLSTICIGIGAYNAVTAASQVLYNMVGTAGANTFTGGVNADHLTGSGGADQLYGGAGDDVILITATADDATGELYDGGTHTSGDALRITGTTTVDLRDDTITGIEILDLTTSSAVQTVSLLASQLAGFTGGANTDSSDSITVTSMLGGSMSASNGIDTFVWADADQGLNRIAGFDRLTDTLRFDFVLNQGSDGAAITTVDGVNDLSVNSLLYAGFGTTSFAQANKGVYVLNLSIGGFQAATESSNAANTTNGIDFSTATAANILANIEIALEDGSSQGGVGVVSRAAGSGVIAGAAGTDIVFILDDGSNSAVVRYQEGLSAEADFAGELTLLGVITGNTGGDFNPAWNGNQYAVFA
jgi:Bacterial Ig-like domain/RTX calcium-binding nonapeptide repeat (4 copies)